MIRSRVIVAELVGTGVLVCAVVGSGIMAAKLADGNDGVALLANTIATAAALVVLILVLGPVCGAHFNPVVTLVDALQKKRVAVETLAVIAAQCAGGIAGVLVAHAMFELPFVQSSLRMRAGPAQLLAEIVATGGLIVVIVGITKARPSATPYAVAAWITSAYWFTASTSFANPAVTLARGFTDTFTGIRPGDVPGFVLAQLVGGLAGAAFSRWLFRSDAASPLDP